MARFLSKSFVASTDVCRFILENGAEITVSLKDLSDDIIHQAAAHGILQKVGDGAANFSKSKDYDGAERNMTAIIDALLEGNWNRKGGGSQAVTDLVEALFRVMDGKRTREQCEKAIDEMDDDGLKALKADDRIKAAVKAIQAERADAKVATAKPKIDLDNLF